MSIGQKFEKIADAVYEKGKTDIISNSKYIEKQATGKVIRLDDVSEIPHKVRIKAGINYFNNDISLVKEFVWLDLVGNEQTAYGYLIEDMPKGHHTLMAIPKEELNVATTIKAMELYKDDNMVNSKYVLVSLSGTYIQSLISDEEMNKIAIYVEDATSLSEAVDVLSKFDFVMNKGYNSLPYGPAEVEVYGKNLFNNDTSLLKEVTYTDSSGTQCTRIGYEPITLPAGEYTFTLTDLDTSFDKYVYGVINDKDGNFKSPCTLTPAGLNKTPLSITLNEGDKVYIYNGHTGLNISERAKAFEAVQIQLEPGPIGTEFEEFKEPQTITATPEGTEVSSICPVMSIMADNDVTVDYWGSYGMQTEYDRFWDNFQYSKGKKMSYSMAFETTRWNDVNFKPKYDIVSSDMNQAFYSCDITDLARILAERGLAFDTSRSTNFRYAFGYSIITRIPTLDLSNATETNYMCANYSSTSGSAARSQLQSIEKMISSETTVFANNALSYCVHLTHCPFEGTVAKNINMQWSTKLNLESVISLFKCLKTFDTTEGSPTVTLSTETWALTESDEFKAEFDGMTGEAVCRAKCWNKA